MIVANEVDTLKGGSPVLSLLDVEVVPRLRWEKVAGIRVDILIAEAKRATDPDSRLSYILEAVETDPLSHSVLCIELSRVRRARSEFEAGLGATKDALRIFPRSAQLNKERGIILDCMTAQGADCLDEAIEAYRVALRLDRTPDADLHGCYGGVLRRKGLQFGNADRVRYLEKSLEHYRTSLSLERHSTYAGLNVLRLLMLMQSSAGDLAGTVEEHKKRMYHLCEFEVTDSHLNAKDQQWWRMFDLADVLALRDEGERSH